MEKLWKIRGMLPYLVVVFLNAFVDLGHKITVQNTVFKIYDGNTQIILTAVVNALILLPFILLFSPAGLLADKYPKNRVMRLSAWAALALTLMITLCYYQGWFWSAFAMTFLLAVQSAFYSPAKYGYIKALAGKDRLAQANGAVQAVTIVAILAGTLVFSILFEYFFKRLSDVTLYSIMQVIAPLGWLLVINSVIELILAYRLPELEQQDTSIKIRAAHCVSPRVLSNNLRPAFNRRVIRLSIFGLAVFWSISQVMLAAFPAFVKESLAITNTVMIQGTLAASGIGIVVGSLLAARFSRRYIETGLIPIGAIGIALGLFILPGLGSITAHMLNFFWIGVMGGLFIVPLNALIQFHANEHELGKVLAGNNLIQNIAMLGFLLLTALVAYCGLPMIVLLLIIALVALVGGLYTVTQLPQSLVRVMLSLLVSRRYRVNVQGFNYIPNEGGVLMLGNHISWIDWAIVQIASPRSVRFVMLKSIYERWYLKWFFKIFKTIPISGGASSKTALKKVTELLNNGEVVCLFPEGGISRTGHLGEFRAGYERACVEVNDDVVILPFYLRGLWGSRFSRSENKISSEVKARLSRDLVIAFGEPLVKTIKADILKRRVFDLSISSWQHYVESLPTIPQAWIDTVKSQGSALAIADTLAEPMSATRALTAAIVFSKKIKLLSPDQNVGLLLPNSIGATVANMAVMLNGQTLVNLNYSASEDSLLAAIEQAELPCLISSKRFIKKLQSKGVNFERLLAAVPVYYLEDVRENISQWSMISHLLCVKFLPRTVLKRLFCHVSDASQTAAILFSSGSEGQPKGVMLSHRNIMANVKQCADVLNLREDDVIMASLPQFHAFGLTVTQFMPLIEGVPMICHADPTDSLGCAKAIAKYRATFMCGTSTFLRLYCSNRRVNPLMLESLRIVVAGAEKLNPAVRKQFKLKFNKEIYEGYGATETTPVASVNLPDRLDTSYWEVQLGSKEGTVGMPLPGSSFKIVDPDSLQELATGEDGLILLGGFQVMRGYLNNPEKTADVIVEIDDMRWYKTGDKGHLDKDGFLTIVDRYSRFAKLAGEMVSLSAVEAAVREALADPELQLAAMNLSDDKKGEKIVLLSERDLSLNDVKGSMLALKMNPLMIPSVCVQVEALPILGSGKMDFSAARKLAESMC